MTKSPIVVSEDKLSNSFLGQTIQVCVVTRDYRRTLEGMVGLGIGPWRVYHYRQAPGITETEYCGISANFKMTLCLAWNGLMLWEIIEPLEGPTIYHDFLKEHGEGIHHVAFSGAEENGVEMPYEEQIREFSNRGFSVIQSGKLKERVRFHYFDTEKTVGTTFEIYDLKGRDLPDPDEWFPGPPPNV